ncbi:hypothetical protein GCM10010393_35170 [Streptomyces gobitricini]|uniref:FXSXX-COOH protein n=1 Tax=Streptomyces gobitricini TaxID=68211 RepID=A0ABN3MD99_9ACTN
MTGTNATTPRPPVPTRGARVHGAGPSADRWAQARGEDPSVGIRQLDIDGADTTEGLTKIQKVRS